MKRFICLFAVLVSFFICVYGQPPVDFSIYEALGRPKDHVVGLEEKVEFGSLLRTKNDSGFFKATLYGFNAEDDINAIIQVRDEIENFDSIALLAKFVERYGCGFLIKIGSDTVEGREEYLPTMIWYDNGEYTMLSYMFHEDDVSSVIVRCLGEDIYAQIKNTLRHDNFTASEVEVLSRFNRLAAKAVVRETINVEK